MDYLTQMLQNLEDIATNPNRNGGIWISFQLFIKFSDGLLRNKELLRTSPNYKEQSENLVKELESIRKNFTKEFGFRLGTNNDLNERFEIMKNGKQSHKFKARLCKFIQSYKNHFI